MGDVLLSSDILTECFCCDLDACKGQCCVEGDSGAPLTLDEVGQLESVLDDVWPQLSAKAQATIDHQGVAYTDGEGDLVTSIVNGRDCVFTCYGADGCCYCATTRLIARGAPPGANPYRAPFTPYAKSVSATARVACTTTAGVCATRP